MTRKLLLSVLAVVVVSGLAFAAGPDKDDMKKSGIVKSVTMDSLTLKADGQDWKFVVTGETTVVAKGGSHMMREAKAAGEKTTITEFVKEGQLVTVDYHKKDGKLYAATVRFGEIRRMKP
jgi:hypothetical protein